MTDEIESDSPIDDGDYAVFVIDVDDLDDGRRRLDLTIVAGPRKGDVLAIVASGIEGDFVDLIGMPGTLVVADGHPSVTIDL